MGPVTTDSRGLGSGRIVLEGNLHLIQDSDASILNDIIGPPNQEIIKDGTGTITLKGSDSANPSILINEGGLIDGSSTAFGTGSITMADGTKVGFGVTGLSLSNKFFLNGDPTFEVDGSQIDTISGAIVDGGTPGDLVKTGSGTLVLTGANTYTGATDIQAGKLSLSGAGSISASSDVTIESGATLDVEQDASIKSLDGAGDVVGDITLSNAAGSFAGNISNNITVSGGSESFGGGTIGGVLSINGTSTVTIADSETVMALSDDGLGKGTLNLYGDLRLNGDSSFSGEIHGGAGGLYLYQGTTTFSGNDTSPIRMVSVGIDTKLVVEGNAERGGMFSAGFINVVGTLEFDTAASTVSVLDAHGVSGIGSMLVKGDGTSGILKMASYLTTHLHGSASGGVALEVSDATVEGSPAALGSMGTSTILLVDGGTLLFDSSGTMPEQITDQGGDSGVVQKDGAGLITLTANNTYGGGTTVNQGGLAAGSDTAFGTGTVTMADGTVMSFAAANLTLANNFSLNGDVEFGGKDGEISGVISDGNIPGKLIVSGPGFLTLSGVNTFTGQTLVRTGSTLLLKSGGSIAKSSELDVEAESTFSGTTSIASLSGAGTVNGDITLTNASGTFSGYDSGNITVAGGAETFNGAVIFSNLLSSGASSITIQGAVSSYSLMDDGSQKGALILDGSLGLSSSSSFFGSITGGSGGLNINGGMTSIGGGTTAGITSIAKNASLVIENPGGSWTGLGMSVNGQLAFETSSEKSSALNLSFLTGGGFLEVDGEGSSSVLKINPSVNNTLKGINNHKISLEVDAATIDASPISLGGAGSTTLLMDGSKIIFEGGGTSSTNITDQGAGDGSVQKEGAGIVIMNGANSYGSWTFINSGGLAAGTDTAFGTGVVNMAEGTEVSFAADGLTLANEFILNGDPTFEVDGTQSDTVSGVITDGSTPGDLVKTGAGTLTLTGTNTYTGTTDIKAGTLSIGVGSIADSSDVNVEDSATLNIASPSVIRSLDGGGTVSGNEFSISDASGTFSGTISTGNVSIIGGTETFDGANIEGKLKISGASPSIIIGSNGAKVGIIVQSDSSAENALVLHGDLTIGGSSDELSVVDGNITGEGGILVQYGGLVLGGDNTFTGKVQVADGVMVRAYDGPNYVASLGNASSVTNDGMVVFFNQQSPNAAKLSSPVSGQGKIILAAGKMKIDATNTLTGANYGGVSLGVSPGTSVETTSTGLGSGEVELFGSGILDINQGSDATIPNVIAGGDGTSGVFQKDGAGLITLTANNTYGGGTTVNQGGLAAGSDTAFGTGAVTMAEGTEVAFAADGLTLANQFILNGDPTFEVDGAQSDTVSGAITDGGTPGDLVKTGTGTLSLTGANSYTGTTEVAAGTLRVDGDSSAATGALTVDGGAALGGTGTVGGSVTVQSGATLTPGDDGADTLTIGGSLTLAGGSTTQYDLGQPGVAGGAQNDLVKVGGDLRLGGTLNVTADPSSGTALPAGVYRLFDYGGSLSGSEAIGTVALAGGDAAGLQTSVTGQVNLVVASMSTSFWNGGNSDNGVLTGGSGTWKAGGPGWTDISVVANGSWNAGASAVFEGLAGNVAVDDSAGNVSVSSMQFANGDGQSYVLSGDTLYAAGQTLGINVGDGTAAGAGIRAEIDSTIDDSQVAGGAQLVKSGLGTLVLGGANAYTGGTTIQSGTLEVTSAGALGTGAVQDNATMTLALSADGTVGNAISGTGSLTKIGSTSVTLTGVDAGTGAMSVDAGTLVLGEGFTPAGRMVDVASGATLDTSAVYVSETSLSGAGTVEVGSAALILSNASGTFSGVVSGSGELRVAEGIETLSGVQASQARLGVDAGAYLDIAGAVSARALEGAGTFVLTDGSTLTVKDDGGGIFAGDISGVGMLSVEGESLALQGNNNWSGATNIASGASLQIMDTQDHAASFSGSSLIHDDGIFVMGNISDLSHDSTLSSTLDGSGVLGIVGGTVRFEGLNLLTGENSPYDGTSLLVEDATVITNSGGLGSGVVGLAGATLDLEQISDGSVSNVITDNNAAYGAGAVIKGGSGLITMSGDNAYGGGTTVNQGGLAAGSDTAFGTGAVTMAEGTEVSFAADGLTLANKFILNGDPTFDVGGSQTDTVSGAITDGGTPGDLVKTGTGTLSLTGTNSYTGTTEVAAGTLRVDGDS
ncbi:autotransporter-associated beta strand repeat-containing protein, partial [Acetobacter malorum]|uniref:autotransporter-associated beta strand repeat-containing protein n=1 Tax=Acetobacter malorum TaxID=178901 RepID=UPI00222E82B1